MSTARRGIVLYDVMPLVLAPTLGHFQAPSLCDVGYTIEAVCPSCMRWRAYAGAGVFSCACFPFLKADGIAWRWFIPGALNQHGQVMASRVGERFEMPT